MRTYSTLAGSLPKLGMALLLLYGHDAASARAGEAGTSKDEVAKGKELFLREWLPNDARAHGGDGLGPTFNDSSCVACHNMGAPGGAGPSNKDVPILTAFPSTSTPDGQGGSGFIGMSGRLATRKKAPAPDAEKAATPPPAPDVEGLARLHLGFRSTRSVIVHRYGTDPFYQEWRQVLLAPTGTSPRSRVPHPSKQDAVQSEIADLRMEAQATSAAFRVPKEVSGFQLVLSRRNTPPLFGTGLIDAVSDAAIEAGAEKPDPNYPETRGRVSRLKDGKIGRFGWKGQTSDLREFVLTACSVELGLEVPGHSQGAIPNAPAYRPPGLDLDDSECASLVAYVRNLSSPLKREPANPREASTIRTGEEAFQAVGCAACHVPKLGDVQNLYSDLLLHDMGETLSDSGAYGVFVNDVPLADAKKGSGDDAKGLADSKKPEGAERREWRTPPLWGFRDSGPYLHDGRAENLEQAVAFHEGQAARSAQQFFLLPPKQRQKIEAFLKSLTAPSEAVTGS
jgi:CxxC motif-containing protein (DUF1111 family)